MDVGAFVEENKRWLLGCALGVAVFFVARGVIGAVYDPAETMREARAAVTSVPPEVYDRQALDAAMQEAERLAALKTTLLGELAWQQDPVYVLEGHGSPPEYLSRVGSDLKRRLLRGANERNVELEDKDLKWPSPTATEEIRSVLFGLELIDAACTRLFAAHDAVRAVDPDAPGLVSLELRIEERRGQRAGAARPRPGEVDLRDQLTQERVTFKFQSDAPTAMAFLESCRVPGKTLVLEDLLAARPQQRGSTPLEVTGTVSGIVFREAGN